MRQSDKSTEPITTDSKEMDKVHHEDLMTTDGDMEKNKEQTHQSKPSLCHAKMNLEAQSSKQELTKFRIYRSSVFFGKKWE